MSILISYIGLSDFSMLSNIYFRTLRACYILTVNESEYGLYTHLFSSSVMLPGIRSDGLDDNRIQKRYTRVVYISAKMACVCMRWMCSIFMIRIKFEFGEHLPHYLTIGQFHF